MFQLSEDSFELSKSSAVAGLGLRILRGLRLNAPEEALLFYDVQVDRIVKRIGNGGPHGCLLYKRFQDFKRHISLDAHAHCDSFKTKRLGREIAGAPQRGNSDFPGISISM